MDSALRPVLGFKEDFRITWGLMSNRCVPFEYLHKITCWDQRDEIEQVKYLAESQERLSKQIFWLHPRGPGCCLSLGAHGLWLSVRPQAVSIFCSLASDDSPSFLPPPPLPLPPFSFSSFSSSFLLPPSSSSPSSSSSSHRVSDQGSSMGSRTHRLRGKADHRDP